MTAFFSSAINLDKNILKLLEELSSRSFKLLTILSQEGKQGVIRTALIRLGASVIVHNDRELFVLGEARVQIQTVDYYV